MMDRHRRQHTRRGDQELEVLLSKPLKTRQSVGLFREATVLLLKLFRMFSNLLTPPHCFSPNCPQDGR